MHLFEENGHSHGEKIIDGHVDAGVVFFINR